MRSIRVCGSLAAVSTRNGYAIAHCQLLGEGRRTLDLGARQPVSLVADLRVSLNSTGCRDLERQRRVLCAEDLAEAPADHQVRMQRPCTGKDRRGTAGKQQQATVLDGISQHAVLQ